jgi:hypothetical protein
LSGSYFLNNKNEKPYFFISKQDSSINFKDEIFVRFNLGLKRFSSSLLWISTILESDIDHYKEKNLNSWMFLRFNSISKLDPLFYENYAFGAPYLSIVKDDLEGASLIYKKGLALFPNDYQLLKDASFHFYFEMKDLDMSYDLYNRLKKFPNLSPVTMGTLSRLEANRGNLHEALLMLTDMQKKYPTDTAVGNKVYEFRYSIKAEIDLECLNTHPNQCERSDLDNTPYIKTASGFKAQKEWTPYRPKWRK